MAIARKTDPDTSHEAAASVKSVLRELQIKVLKVLYKAGKKGLVDYHLEKVFKNHGSTYRTRRNELVEKGLVVDSGRREILPRLNNHKRVVWVHHKFARKG